jgi:hypothetical protein
MSTPTETTAVLDLTPGALDNLVEECAYHASDSRRRLGVLPSSQSKGQMALDLLAHWPQRNPGGRCLASDAPGCPAPSAG